MMDLVAPFGVPSDMGTPFGVRRGLGSSMGVPRDTGPPTGSPLGAKRLIRCYNNFSQGIPRDVLMGPGNAGADPMGFVLVF